MKLVLVLRLPSFHPYVKVLSRGICEDFVCLVHAAASSLAHLPGHDRWINLNMLNQFCGNLSFSLENVNSLGSPSLGPSCVIALL
jgi:hypothetical protein